MISSRYFLRGRYLLLRGFSCHRPTLDSAAIFFHGGRCSNVVLVYSSLLSRVLVRFYHICQQHDTSLVETNERAEARLECCLWSRCGWHRLQGEAVLAASCCLGWLWMIPHVRSFVHSLNPSLISIIQVAYFNFSRQLIVSDNQRKQIQGQEHLREAKEFSEWSKKDREARLPKLTEEQREQMRQYLLIVQRHGLSKAFAGEMQRNNDDDDCPGCPVLKQTRKVAAALSNSPSDS